MEPVKIYKSNGMEANGSMIDFSSIEPVDELKAQYEDYTPAVDNRFKEIKPFMCLADEPKPCFIRASLFRFRA